MSDGFRELELHDEEQGLLKFLLPIPQANDPWGVLAPFKDTVWAESIQVVSGDVFSHALHGWATPLKRVLGVGPKYKALRLRDQVCGLKGSCIGFKKWICNPGAKVPDCYEAPGMTEAEALLATRVVLAWREGRYVIVVESKGFSLS